MSTSLKLAAELRTKTGKGANRQLRAKGMTPAVFYTPEGKNVLVQVKEAALLKMYGTTGRTTLFDLEIDENGKKYTHPCLVWDVEYYPTQQRFQHVDFYGVDLDKEIKITVAIEYVGTSKGVKIGGKLETYRDRLQIISKPATLPKKILVDVSNLDINQGYRVADLPMPEGVRPSYDDNFAIVSVLAPGSAKEEDDK